MGVVEVLEIGSNMKKTIIFTIRCCFRSVSNHRFLVGNLCFLIFLYRSFPFIFSLLISVSPVLICTAILLGTILSFGQPNIPEIEPETAVSRDSIAFEQNENQFYVDRYSNKPTLSESEVCKESVRSNVEEEKPRESGSGDGEIWEDTIDEPEKDDVENHYSLILKSQDGNNESEDVDSFNYEMVNAEDSFNFPWKHVENKDDEENEDIVSDSWSDGSESSSPDASMTDIIPMLDELHPLLDEDSSNAIQISCNASCVISEHSSSRPSTSDSESVDEIENFEIEEDDNEDDEDDDGQLEKDEGSKSAILWTEEDQKNLMDLGSSEIERNQRLENLILRRRKNLSMVPEINLMDLESSDIPPHVGAISTSRQNPFDDSCDNNIPGSAPSVLLQIRNPFEIPYESSQEKANSMGDDGFQEQLPFSKRHEMFSVGPSLFGPNRQDVRLRPYFVPERMISEESGFSRDLSDLRASSVTEMESVGSIADLEERKLLEDDRSPRELSDDAMSRTDEEVIVVGSPEEDEETISKIEPFTEDVISEPQLISEMNHVSEHIGHGSQSSSDEDEDSSDSKKSYNRGSSSSLMSESSERTFNEKTDGGAEESGDMNITSAKEPVYDTSPTSVKKNLSSSSSSSVSCDVHAETNQSLPPVLVKRMVSFAERDSENREIEKEITSDTATETVASPNSDGDYEETNKRLMSTPSGAGGSASHFHDIERNLEHLEVPVPNTPVESNEKMRTIQNLNIPEIYEIDHDTSSSIGSPFSPDFISMPSSASSHVDMEIVHENADEIKEIDEGLSSNLDSIGDFNMNEFEKNIINSVGESSTMRETRHEVCKCEDGTKGKKEIDEMDGRDLTFKEKEDKRTDLALNHNYLDSDYLPKVLDGRVDMGTVMPELKARKGEDIDEENEANLVIYALNYNNQIIEKNQSDMHSIDKVDYSSKKDESTSLAIPENTSAMGPTHETLIHDSVGLRPMDTRETAPEYLDSIASVKGKGNKSESSSSSSSSSSSESDTE